MGWGRLSLLKELKRRGYANLGVLNPDMDTLDLAAKIGTIVKIPGLSEVQKLTPKSKEDNPRNTYSGNYGTDEFPMHTDLAHWYQPPRYFLLRCKAPDPEVGTFFLPFKKALKGLPDVTQKRALFKPRRKLDRKMFFLRFTQDEVFRWDPLYIIPENQEARNVAEHLCSLEKECFDRLYLTQRAQSVLVDNWRVLHGRSDVGATVSSRLIERVYFSELHL